MICIIACGSEKVVFIEAALRDFGVQYETIQIEDVGNTNFQKYSGIIISGSPILLTDDVEDRYVKLFNFLSTYENPVLGICFGHQVLGLVYGASISIGDSIKGLEEVVLLKETQLFNGIDTPASFDQNHREHITVPDEFVLLARSSSCEHEAMQHKTKSQFGVQFHPETSGEVGKKLLKNFISLC